LGRNGDWTQEGKHSPETWAKNRAVEVPVDRAELRRIVPPETFDRAMRQLDGSRPGDPPPWPHGFFRVYVDGHLAAVTQEIWYNHFTKACRIEAAELPADAELTDREREDRIERGLPGGPPWPEVNTRWWDRQGREWILCRDDTHWTCVDALERLRPSPGHCTRCHSPLKPLKMDHHRVPDECDWCKTQ
jgi:hypothetical protein